MGDIFEFVEKAYPLQFSIQTRRSKRQNISYYLFSNECKAIIWLVDAKTKTKS